MSRIAADQKHLYQPTVMRWASDCALPWHTSAELELLRLSLKVPTRVQTMRRVPIRQPLVLVMISISVLVHTPAAVGANWASEHNKMTEADFMTLPLFCRAKTTQQHDRKIQDAWTLKYGPAWQHMHHFCFGSKALNLSYRYFNSKEKRRYFSAQAVKEFDYVLDNTGPSFSLRTELMIQRGRALTISQSYDDAKQSFEEALKLDPRSVDAWVALSDMYSQIGKDAEAIKVLEQAIQTTGSEHKKITARLNDLKKKPNR